MTKRARFLQAMYTAMNWNGEGGHQDHLTGKVVGSYARTKEQAFAAITHGSPVTPRKFNVWRRWAGLA